MTFRSAMWSIAVSSFVGALLSTERRWPGQPMLDYIMTDPPLVSVQMACTVLCSFALALLLMNYLMRER